MILPMGMVIPPSIKAIMGITTSPVCLASTHSPWAAYLIPTVGGILYLERKFLIPSSDSTRHQNGFFCFPIFLKKLSRKDYWARNESGKNYKRTYRFKGKILDNERLFVIARGITKTGKRQVQCMSSGTL